MNENINGIILINKKAGYSSNKVVNKVKYSLGVKKAGHLGTLDVLGEGLLPVTINKGTKVFEYFLSKDKEYYTIFKFGQTTDTLDSEGEIIACDDKIISLDMVKSVVKHLIGKQKQMPPIYSAKKIGGQTAYKLARAGQDVQLSPKEIEIYDIECQGELSPNTFAFKVHCSSGTYIRSLARDMATLLGTYGIMQYIQRTRCGVFSLSDAYTLEDVENGDYKIIPLDTLFSSLPQINLDEKLKAKILNGVGVKCDKEEQYRVYGEGEFLGIGQAKNGTLTLSLRLC